MNPFVWQFYQTKNDIEGIKDPFYEVILFDENSKLSWEEVDRMACFFPRPWFELCKLPASDRLEFFKAFWKKSLPYRPDLHRFLEMFFSKLDDIAVFLTKDFPDSPYVVELVYSFKDKKSFFRGRPACSEEEIEQLESAFDHMLPADYLAFFQIHNGFAKVSDTGLILAENVFAYTLHLQSCMQRASSPLYSGQKMADPKSLIPFYQCFGRNAFQCFYTEWTPKNSIGNVYYSADENKISDITAGPMDLGFTSFVDWLMFYMEEVEM